VSLYLHVEVGAGRYLLDARLIIEIRPELPHSGGIAHRPGGAMPAVDLRKLFDEPASPQGCCILFTQASGAAALIVDRVVGLIEFADAEFRPLPPIGPLGAMIDGVATRGGDRYPLLRLRGERALATAVVVG